MTHLSTDTGGTFTDFVVWDGKDLRTFKMPSTPASPDEAIRNGISEIGGHIGTFSHGTTVATNIVLERKGARTALVTTAGFRDVLEIGRQTRPSLYEPVPRPSPLVPRRLRFEAEERTGPDGNTIVPLDPGDIEGVVKAVKEAGAESVAVSLLFSFLDPSHEAALGRALEDAGIRVSISSEVLPIFREYERTSTTVMDAYVKPRMVSYIEGLEVMLPRSRMTIMRSNGGVARPSIIKRAPVTTLFSGPAGGVAAALHVGRTKGKGYNDLITFDMGGTSTDVSTIVGGEVRYTSATTIDGLPVTVPMMDIVSVGAGGGSLAWLDDGGALRVGPGSAGADPGPICYGRGGKVPTVTDCDLLAGLLDPDNFLGGRMALDIDAARGGAEELAAAASAGLSPDDLIRGVTAVVNSHMARAIRVVTVERGLDPADFTMVAFGGAGPMHAALLAREMGIGRVLVPFAAGVLSALGLLVADTRLDYHRTCPVDTTDRSAAGTIAPVLDEMRERARADLEEQGLDPRKAKLAPSLDMRYTGQSYEINVPFRSIKGAVKAFHDLHARAYTYALEDRPVEVVNVRLTAIHPTRTRPRPRFKGKGDPSPRKKRPVLLDTGGGGGPRWSKAAVHGWDDLRPGHRGKGPAVIEERGFTVVVPRGFRWSMDDHGNIELRDGGGP